MPFEFECDDMASGRNIIQGEGGDTNEIVIQKYICSCRH